MAKKDKRKILFEVMILVLSHFMTCWRYSVLTKIFQRYASNGVDSKIFKPELNYFESTVDDKCSKYEKRQGMEKDRKWKEKSIWKSLTKAAIKQSFQEKYWSETPGIY